MRPNIFLWMTRMYFIWYCLNCKAFSLDSRKPPKFQNCTMEDHWSWQWLALNLTTSCMWCPKSWPFPTFPSDKQDGKVTPGNPVSYLPVSVYSGIFNFQALSICLYNPSGTNESIIRAINFEAVDLIEKLWFLYTQKAFQTISTDPAELKL